MFWLPESPRALLAQGKREEADRILRTMASQNDMLHALPAGTLRESPTAAAALEAPRGAGALAASGRGTSVKIKSKIKSEIKSKIE